MFSYPPIYKCIEDVNKIEWTFGPLSNLARWVEEEDKRIIGAAGLTGSTRRMVEIGLSCYNSYPIGLDEVFATVINDEQLEVVF